MAIASSLTLSISFAARRRACRRAMAVGIDIYTFYVRLSRGDYKLTYLLCFNGDVVSVTTTIGPNGKLTLTFDWFSKKLISR